MVAAEEHVTTLVPAPLPGQPIQVVVVVVVVRNLPVQAAGRELCSFATP